jgi:hypothetical protein
MFDYWLRRQELIVALTLTFSPDDPQAPDQSQQRHEVRGESGDDRMRHGGGSPEISRVGSGGPVSGSSAGTVACHATVIAASVDPAPAVATAIAAETANSKILTHPAELDDKSPLTAPDNGIVAETCDCCMGRGRGHFGKCSVCRGTGWVFA